MDLFTYLGLSAAGGLAWLLTFLGTPLLSASEEEQRRAKWRAAALGREMGGALERGEIQIVYQPKLALRTLKIAGVEALARWQHPKLGSVDRKTLIELFSQRGRLDELTVWMLRQALSHQCQLKAHGHEVMIHINVSAASLTSDRFVSEICALVETSEGRIGFEITETELFDHSDATLDNIKRIIKRGIAIAIDDYGAGRSSLAYLKQLPARELKIDKMFISAMATSHRDPLIVRSTIDLAHALDLEVVGEGVESLATLSLLRVMGCDMAQGYAISPPLPLAGLIAYLDSGAYRTLLGDAATINPSVSFWARRSRSGDGSQPVQKIAS